MSQTIRQVSEQELHGRANRLDIAAKDPVCVRDPPKRLATQGMTNNDETEETFLRCFVTERLFRSLFTFFAVVVFAAAGPVMAQDDSEFLSFTNMCGMAYATDVDGGCDGLTAAAKNSGFAEGARADLEDFEGVGYYPGRGRVVWVWWVLGFFV